MVRWIGGGGGGGPGSGIADALNQYAALRYGDTLTPALKQEQLLAAQREAQNILDLQGALRNSGNAWGSVGRSGPPGGGARFTPPAPPRAQPSDRMAVPGQAAPDFDLPAPNVPATGMGGADLAFETMPQIDPAWAPIRAGIFDGESNGDFDALWGFSNRPGGRFEGVQPSRMTVAEVMDFTDPSGEYGQWVKSQLGYVATPVGAYQGVGTTIRDAVAAGVLDPREPFNAAAQERFGQWVYQTQGTGAWEGYRGPGNPDRYASAFTGGAAPEFLPGATASPLTGAPATGPGEYNPLNPGQNTAEMLALAVGAGVNPTQVGDMLRIMAANSFGAENQATTDAFVGAGGRYEDTYSGFAADQNRQERGDVRGANVTMRGQDVQSADRRFLDEQQLVTVIRDGRPVQVRKGDLLPTDQAVLSNTEVQGQILQDLAAGGMSRQEQLAAAGAEPKNPAEASRYVSASNPGQVFPSFDGLTDATTGDPLPADALKTSVTATSREGTGLQAPVITGVQNQIIGLENARGMLDAAREVAQDPTNFGIAGAIKSGVQNLRAQYDQLRATNPQGAQALDNEVAGMLDSVMSVEDPDGVLAGMWANYDPDLGALHLYGQLLPYSMAAALAQQEGRGLSNQDVERFAAIVGNPASLWSSQPGFLNKMDVLEREIDRLLGQSRNVLTNGVGAAAPPAPAQPDLPQVTDDASYEALPSGTEFMAPDGTIRVKP